MKDQNPNSYRIKRYDDSMVCDPSLDDAYVYQVKVFDPQGKLMKIISKEELITRPMEEAKYAI